MCGCCQLPAISIVLANVLMHHFSQGIYSMPWNTTQNGFLHDTHTAGFFFFSIINCTVGQLFTVYGPLFYNLLHKELKININHSFAVLYFCTEWYNNLFFAPLYSSTFSIIIIKLVQTVPVDNRVLFSNAQLGPHIPEQLHTEHWRICTNGSI